MKQIFALAALTASANAFVTRDSACCFSLTAHGGPGGPIGQLSDGQNRIGDDSLRDGKYCLGAGTGLTDAKGRGCILTPPTTQWQCDEGASPTPGFSVGCNGTLSHKGETTFYSCPTGQHGGHNIYTEPVKGEPGCTPIWLVADNCGKCEVVTSTSTAPCPSSTVSLSSSSVVTSSSSAVPPPPPPSSSVSHPPPSSAHPPPTWTVPPPTQKSSCPGQLTGAWEFPHLIVPVDWAQPNKAFGTVFNGTAGGTMATVFNFDVPQSAAGKTCSLQFLFPTHAQLETSDYSWTAPGKFEFGILESAVNKSTTYSNVPDIRSTFGSFEITPGSATDIGKCPHGCPAGKTISFYIQADDGASSINYFQDSNPCPIGLYVTIE